ncbi:uncharacterized protein LOC143575801 [Bidens hawaiensis]|uniref:uncharacterized protein LOC143575801 n=1 Tax=Bidens hawaiensis TaxID=980011 RepID=UPI0040492535
MNESEGITEFLSKVTTIVKNKRAYGEVVSDQLVVEKVQRSLPYTWDYVVTTTEESKDLTQLSVDQLMGSLQAHEAQVNRAVDVVKEEHVFLTEVDEIQFVGHGRGRGPGHGCGRGRGRVGGRERRSIQCYNCNKFGHVKADCWAEPQTCAPLNENDPEKEEGDLFMAVDHGVFEDSKKDYTEQLCVATNGACGNIVWFLDSGCSNHMNGNRSLFQTFDETKKAKVNMGEWKEHTHCGYMQH